MNLVWTSYNVNILNILDCELKGIFDWKLTSIWIAGSGAFILWAQQMFWIVDTYAFSIVGYYVFCIVFS